MDIKKTSRSFLLLFVGYAILSVCLVLYSLTQVDLNLALSRFPAWYSIQQSFQYIGYYQRPLSTLLYLILLLFLFSFYALALWRAFKKQLTKKDTWKLVILVSTVLLFSYNAFSYDLFNYIFDAKIVSHYNLNPYLYSAQDFKGDPMLGFMRWVHRTYPYGPTWLLVTVPLSYIGLQYFLPTLLLFKAMIIGSYIGSVYIIGKITKLTSKNDQVLPMVFFALQPLVIIETLVSAHNDMVMMFFSLLAFYFLLQKKPFYAYIWLFISVGVKFATIFLLPVFLLISFWQYKKRPLNYQFLFFLSVLCMIPAVIFSSVRTEIQPWYFLWVIPFVSFVVKERSAVIMSAFFSLGLLLLYIPYLYTGAWDPPIPLIKSWMVFYSILATLVLGIVFWAIDARKSSKSRNS